MVARQFPHDGALLLQEPPLVLLPALAVAIGVTSALLLQQLHYWLRRPGGLDHEGRHWVYLTIDEWHRQMPFLSGRTIRRELGGLESRGLVLSARLAPDPRDQTKSYTLDYDALYSLPGVGDVPFGQIGHMEAAKPAMCNGPKGPHLKKEQRLQSEIKSSRTRSRGRATSRAAAAPIARKRCTRRASGIDCWTESDPTLAAAIEAREAAEDIADAVASLPVTKAVPGAVAQAIERSKARRKQGAGQGATLVEPDTVRRARADARLAELSAARAARGEA